MTVIMQKCAKCGLKKSIEENFSRMGKDKKGRTLYYRYCKPCASGTARVERLRNVFQITPEEYDQLELSQGGMCAICKRMPAEGKNRLSIDHNHATGMLRGLLCWLCNRVLGMLKDDPECARRVAQYLEHPPAVEIIGERYMRKGRITKKRVRRGSALDPFMGGKFKGSSRKETGKAISLGRFLKTVAWG